MTPSLPVVEGVTVHLLAGTWAFSGEAFPENWENTPYNGELEVGSIPGGATIRASHKLLVLDGTNGNAPISFLSGDSTAGGASTFSLLADSATRADPTPYEQYRQSLLSMVSQNGVSDANAYKSISVTTLSGDAQANPKELEQIILLLELLNAQPGDAQAEALIEQLAASNLSSEELRTLLESADTYGMEGLYAITEEKYAYALSDYLYAVSSLEHWDKQIANMDSWAGNASLAVSAVGLGVKLGGAGINAMTQAYKAGGNLSDIWSSAKKALLDEATSYVKDFNFFKNLKNYKKLRKSHRILGLHQKRRQRPARQGQGHGEPQALQGPAGAGADGQGRKYGSRRPQGAGRHGGVGPSSWIASCRPPPSPPLCCAAATASRSPRFWATPRPGTKRRRGSAKRP